MSSIRRCATCQQKSHPYTHKKLVACTATTCKCLSPKNLLYNCANWSGNEVVTSVKPKSRQKLVRTITHRAACRQFVCHTASIAGNATNYVRQWISSACCRQDSHNADKRLEVPPCACQSRCKQAGAVLEFLINEKRRKSLRHRMSRARVYASGPLKRKTSRSFLSFGRYFFLSAVTRVHFFFDGTTRNPLLSVFVLMKTYFIGARYT